MDEDEFAYWAGRYEREPFGMAVSHDNWATLFAFLEAQLRVLLSIHSANLKKGARPKANVDKKGFNRSRTGDIIAHVNRVLEDPLNLDQQRRIADRFKRDRGAARRILNVRRRHGR